MQPHPNLLRRLEMCRVVPSCAGTCAGLILRKLLIINNVPVCRVNRGAGWGQGRSEKPCALAWLGKGWPTNESGTLFRPVGPERSFQDGALLGGCPLFVRPILGADSGRRPTVANQTRR